MGTTYPGTVDAAVKQLKEQKRFKVLNTKDNKTFEFVFEPKTQELFFLSKKKKYKVRNPGSALYSFANRSNYFELHLENSLRKPIDRSPLIIIENIELV